MSTGPSFSTHAEQGSLPRCLQPMSAGDFLERAWEKEVTHLGRNDVSYFDGLFSLKDVDPYLEAARKGPKNPPVHLSNARQPSGAKVYRPDGMVDIPGVNAAFRGGDTLILNGMRYSWRPVEELCREFEAFFQDEVGANLYLTPARSQGFSAHFDTHEVFVLQLSGTKLWRIYHQEIEAPLVNQYYPLKTEQLPAPSIELLLQPGDTLYVPRGRVHEALSTDATSMHLSVGIHTTRWVDVLQAALSQAALRDVSLRKSLPAGILFDHPESNAVLRGGWERVLQTWDANASAAFADALQATREAVLRSRPPE